MDSDSRIIGREQIHQFGYCWVAGGQVAQKHGHGPSNPLVPPKPQTNPPHPGGGDKK